MNQLYTIGHSTQEFDCFVELLKKHQIEAIADVRSGPYSKRFPWFNKESLQETLKEHGIHYVFMGKELGARRDEPCCYIGTRADYDLISQCELFKQGIERIQHGLQKIRISLMCAEKDPIDCHRTILVARHAQAFTDVQHILSDGSLETHRELESRLLDKLKINLYDMFSTPEKQLAKAYKLRGEQINYDKKNYI